MSSSQYDARKKVFINAEQTSVSDHPSHRCRECKYDIIIRILLHKENCALFFSAGSSSNRPKLCSSAAWNQNATTFADNGTIGVHARGIFVNNNNTVYVANNQFDRIHIWLEGNSSLLTTMTTNTNGSQSIFVSPAEDIYIGYDNPYRRVNVWRLNASTYVSTFTVSDACLHIFIDKSESLYCSLSNVHQVIRRSLDSNDSKVTTVVGQPCYGFASNLLRQPRGIYVDSNSDLYVADCDNYRVQLFPAGQPTGITIAGWGATGTIGLNQPSDVALDADAFIFIVDTDNHRIIRSGPNGFRCVVGCSNTHGSGSNQLDGPQRMAFDSYGSIFTTDLNNNRVQKFLLMTNSCSE